jgi:hypothetical protein
VHPGSIADIMAHLLPNPASKAIKRLSSSFIHSDFTTAGDWWLRHRSRHCFPIQPWHWAARNPHSVGPCSAIQLIMKVSSSWAQEPLISSGSNVFS